VEEKYLAFSLTLSRNHHHHHHHHHCHRHRHGHQHHHHTHTHTHTHTHNPALMKQLLKGQSEAYRDGPPSWCFVRCALPDSHAPLQVTHVMSTEVAPPMSALRRRRDASRLPISSSLCTVSGSLEPTAPDGARRRHVTVTRPCEPAVHGVS
jgi:hypothetical protein